MLTVSQIIQASKYAVLKEMDRLNYIANDPHLVQESFIGFTVTDPDSGKSVPAIWTIEEDSAGLEKDRIMFASQILKNAVLALDSILGIDSYEDDDE